MLIPVGNGARSKPGSSYRVVSPLVSHHHFNGRSRPGLGQPAAVWLTRKRLYNPWDRVAAGLGQLSYEKAKEILMYGSTRGYTDEQMRAANLVVYPARTAEGALVSAPRIEAGEFEITGEAAAGERALVTQSAGAVAIAPKPVRGPRPPLYRNFEDCIPGDQSCIDRNAARAAANHAILTNVGRAYNRAMCEHNCARVTAGGHPEHCLNCAALNPPVPVPSAPGSRTLGAPGAALPIPPAELPIVPVKLLRAPAEQQAAAAAASPDAAGVNLHDTGRLAAVEETARGAAATVATFLTGSIVGGIPNWLLIAGAAATGLVLLGKKR